MIKLIAIDLDGTLLTDEKTITEHNKQTLLQAKEQGVYVVLCTGRPLFAIEAYLDRLGLRGHDDYSITFNGSSVQKNDTGEMFMSHSLSHKDIQEVARIMASVNLPLDVVSVDTMIHLPTASEDKPSIYETMNPLLKVEYASVEELDTQREFNKMVVGIEASYLDEQIALLPPELFERFNIMKSRENLLEIVHKEASKANGIAHLASQLGIKQEEVMAIGDEENDRSMIEYAGVGVVMANGNETLKEIAQFVTKSNQEDGVAYAVEQLVLVE